MPRLALPRMPHPMVDLVRLLALPPVTLLALPVAALPLPPAGFPLRALPRDLTDPPRPEGSKLVGREVKGSE